MSRVEQLQPPSLMAAEAGRRSSWPRRGLHACRAPAPARVTPSKQCSYVVRHLSRAADGTPHSSFVCFMRCTSLHFSTRKLFLVFSAAMASPANAPPLSPPPSPCSNMSYRLYNIWYITYLIEISVSHLIASCDKEGVRVRG
eukprot:scaffold2016_cov131-Isochrysis_galbana.AAC.2